MTNFDGTDVFTSNVVAGDKLDKVGVWHGTTLPTSPTNKIPTDGLFFKTDTGILFHNTGTLASPVFTQISRTITAPKLVLLDAYIASIAEGTHTFTPSTALKFEDYSEFIVLIHGQASASFILQMKINGDSGTKCGSIGSRFNTTYTGLSQLNTSQYQLLTALLIGAGGDNFGGRISIQTSDSRAGLTPEVHALSHMYGTSVAYEVMAHNARGSANSDLASIEIKTSTSTWKIGTRISTYGVLR